MMKESAKDQDKTMFFDHNAKHQAVTLPVWTLSKLMVCLMVLISLPYLVYSLQFMFCSPSRPSSSPTPIARVQSNGLAPKPSTQPGNTTLHPLKPSTQPGNTTLDPLKPSTQPGKTTLDHVVFGIAASARLWDRRKHYIRQWWRPGEMKGFVWLDKPVPSDTALDPLLPTRRISSDTSRFNYRNPRGDRSAIRISRIVSETLRVAGKNSTVRWFVMGDDDTVFVADNLIRVLNKYDHSQFYYIGSSSESHLQNIYFSYGMAYGGGGFAISYPLAEALAKMQDGCIQRYPELYGSDDRIHACMAELGVPLTKEPGLHQFDVYGRLFGLLAAHPVAPFVSLHHLDVVEPIFPDTSRVRSVERLLHPAKLDSASLLQQSVCYDRARNWTVSVSWGYAVQIYNGILSGREMEIPARTFLNWYREADYTAFAFNTRSLARTWCLRPHVYYMTNTVYNANLNTTASEYVRQRALGSRRCAKIPEMSDPVQITRVEVYKKPDPDMWERAPRRNCCRVLPTKKDGTMVVDVGPCRDGEIVAF